ncbi:MAG: phosphate signaling complex PhoU family protein, partial [Rhodospirillaceae bacterium]
MASEHTLKRFDEELERLNATINEMGGLTESQFAKALTAVREMDTSMAEEVIVADARVDALDQAVQEQTVQLLALRQPMAVDLRVVLSSIKIAAAL